MAENFPRFIGSSQSKPGSETDHRFSSVSNVNPEVLVLLRQLQQELAKDVAQGEERLLLEEYLGNWLNTSRKGLQPKTSDDYRRTIKKHVLPYLGDTPLVELNTLMVDRFYNHLVQAGTGVRTVRLVHSILHRALEKAVLQQLVFQNPSSKATIPRYVHEEMKVWDEVQVKQFLAASVDSPYAALYKLALTTGMRMGELLGLKWTDLQWPNGRLSVQRQLQVLRGQGFLFQEPKTRSGRRTIQLGMSTLDALREHHEQQQRKAFAVIDWHDNDLIFPSKKGTPLDPSNLRLDFQHIIKKAGIPRIRFHDLRHTAASLMLNHGIPVIVVSKILGHSTPSITLDIYGHLYHEMQDEAVHLMDNLVTM